MKPELRKYKIHIALGVFFVVIIPLSYFGIKKIIEIGTEKVVKKQKMQVEREMHLSNASEIPKLEQDVEYIEKNRDKMNILKEDKGDAEASTDLYGDLEKIAASTGNSNVHIKLPKYIANASEKDAEFAIKPLSTNFFYVTVEMVGTFNDSLNFLHTLDNMKYISDVISFKMEKPKKIEGKKLKDEIDRYGGKELVKSKFYIVFYSKTDKDGDKNNRAKLADPNVDMKLVEEAKNIPLPER